MRLLLRILGVWSLLAAVITGTIDATKSLGAGGELVVTSLGEYWFKIDPGSLNTLQAGVERHVHPWLWDPVIFTALQAPAWLLFAILGLFLCWLGRPRRRLEAYGH